jgi:hypothetical protein
MLFLFGLFMHFSCAPLFLRGLHIWVMAISGLTLDHLALVQVVDHCFVGSLADTDPPLSHVLVVFTESSLYVLITSQLYVTLPANSTWTIIISRDIVTAWYCYHAILLPRDTVTTWYCYHAILLSRDIVTTWYCYHVILLPREIVTMWQWDHVTMLPSDNVATWQCCHVTMLPRDNVATWQWDHDINIRLKIVRYNSQGKFSKFINLAWQILTRIKNTN